MSERRHLLLASALLGAIAALLLFAHLQTSPYQVADEGLYGMYGRTMLRHDTWLHVVNAAGDYPTGAVKFSKPPLSIWAVATSMQAFGPSLFSLRLPFALASLGIALLCLAFGRLLTPGPRGTWLGFLWGVLFLACHGTTAYGRTATIEPMLVAFIMLALYAHARALHSGTWRAHAWTALAGLAIGGAFMTKQVVCALAILPIVGVELARLRREPRAVVLRLLAALGLPLLAIGGWFLAFHAKVGHAALDVLWQHAIVNRVSGFDGTHHQNFLNRMAGLLDLHAAPASWELGILGLALMLVPAEPWPRERREAGWLVAGAGICAWLAFDVGSRAILPWYVFSLLPAIALGHAWLVVHTLSAVREGWPQTRHAQLTAAAGAGALMLTVGAAARELMPALLAVAIFAFTFVLIDAPRFARVRPRLALLWSAAWVVLMLCGTLAAGEYRATEPNTYAVLGRALFERGAKRVSVDTRALLHTYTRITFFGADLASGGDPWLGTPDRAKQADARVQTEALPSELRPRAGVTLIRGIGAYALLGDLRQPAFDASALDRALLRGPLTFEAEQLATGLPYTQASDSGASGGAVRRSAPRPRERSLSFALARGTTPRLPVGRYKAEFWITLGCKGARGEVLGQAIVTVRGAKTTRTLRCASGASATSPTPATQVLGFELKAPVAVELLVQVTQGAVTLDRITLTRTGPPTPTAAPTAR